MKSAKAKNPKRKEWPAKLRTLLVPMFTFALGFSAEPLWWEPLLVVTRLGNASLAISWSNKPIVNTESE